MSEDFSYTRTHMTGVHGAVFMRRHAGPERECELVQ
jgi:hypothetical protein